VQVKAQIVVTLVNEPCMAQAQAGRLCQFKYLLHTAIVRDGVEDWRQVGWFNAASLFNDSTQGGAPVVQGPIGVAGEFTTDRRFHLPLYRSAGAPTQHRPFADTDFEVEVTFAQLCDALRMIVAARSQADARALPDADIAHLFGPRWRDPAAWSLLDANVGQEVFNRIPDQRAFIGGDVRSLSVSAASPPH